MNDPTYDAWRHWRALLLSTLRQMAAGQLAILAAELRSLAEQIERDVARREEAAEQRDARLYRSKGR